MCQISKEITKGANNFSHHWINARFGAEFHKIVSICPVVLFCLFPVSVSQRDQTKLHQEVKGSPNAELKLHDLSLMMIAMSDYPTWSHKLVLCLGVGECLHCKSDTNQTPADHRMSQSRARPDSTGGKKRKGSRQQGNSCGHTGPRDRGAWLVLLASDHAECWCRERAWYFRRKREREHTGEGVTCFLLNHTIGQKWLEQKGKYSKVYLAFQLMLCLLTWKVVHTLKPWPKFQTQIWNSNPSYKPYFETRTRVSNTTLKP